MKVMANTAITTVAISDCNEVSHDSRSAAGTFAAGCGAGGCAAVSGTMFIQPDRGREDENEDASALVLPRAARLASWWKQRRGQHTQELRRKRGECAPPP